jgi:hypothetical protein
VGTFTGGYRLGFGLTDGTTSGSMRARARFSQIVEVDDHGDVAVVVVFDPDDLEAAYAELDQRFAAGEAAAHGRAQA